MSKNKKAHTLMDAATDKTSDALRGVKYQDSDAITDEFIASVDEAAKLASAKAKKQQ